MNKVFKKVLIGILFTLFTIPIISKNNVYAASTTVKKNNYHNCTNSKGEGFSISDPFYCKGVASITGSCFGKDGAGGGDYSSCTTKMYLISATNKKVVATSNSMGAVENNTQETLTGTINIDATKDYGVCYILLPATHTCNTSRSGVEGFCWPDNTSTFKLEVTGDYTKSTNSTSSSVAINTSSGQSSLFAVNGVSHIIVPCVLNDGASSGNYASASMKVSLIKSNNSVIKSFSHSHTTGYSSSNYDNGISRSFQYERIKGTAYAIIDGLDINTDYGDCYIKVEGSNSNSGSAKASYAYTSPAIVVNSAKAEPAPYFTVGATLTKVDLAYGRATTATYTVEAARATSYEWYLDGRKITTGKSYTANIENLTHGNHTLYCKAINASGFATTNTITFNVNKTPIFTSGNLTHPKISAF